MKCKEKDNCLVSVIIPAFNGEAFLAEAVDSICKQNYHPLEIIIIDDGSNDNTEQIAKTLQGNIKYVSQRHTGGPAAGRNKGLRIAEGDLIAFLDQDDIWPENKLNIQVEKINESSKQDVVLGRTQMLRMKTVKDGKYEFEKHSKPWVHLMPSCALFRKTVFDKVGLFDEKLTYYGNDFDWFLRARELSVSIFIQKEVTLFWRIHDKNQTHDKSIRDHSLGRDHALTEILKKSLDRRRQSDNSNINIKPLRKFTDLYDKGSKNPNLLNNYDKE